MKVEYLVNFSQYFESFTKAIIGSCNETFLRKVSKTLAESDEDSTLKSFSFMC